MRVVIDANVALALVVPLAYSEAAAQQMRWWHEQETEIQVPALWSYEVVSALRKAMVVLTLSPEMAMAALQDLLALGIREVLPTPALHRKALEWATRLNQTVAYDAAYLALAEQAEAEFWTADRRLVEVAGRAGVSWVHHLGN